MAGKEKIIELKNITKTYENGFTAVSDFNLYVNKGEFVTFLGPSGCGKTTTLRMIAGFELPTSGEILLNDSGHIMAFTPTGVERLDADCDRQIAEFVKIPGFRKYTILTNSGMYRIRAE